jgi:hypothetical protein
LGEAEGGGYVGAGGGAGEEAFFAGQYGGGGGFFGGDGSDLIGEAGLPKGDYEAGANAVDFVGAG